MTIAARLKHAREFRSRSIRGLQSELKAQGIRGASYANVHAYFRGTREPPVAFLRAAANALQVREPWLISGDGHPTQIEEQLPSDASGTAKEETSQRKKLRMLFEREFPEYKAFPKLVAQAVEETFRRFLAALPDPEIPVRTFVAMSADIRRLLLLPFWNWGFRHQLSDEEFTNYALGILNALMLIMPARGRGDQLGGYRPKRTPITEKNGGPVGWDGKSVRLRRTRGSRKRKQHGPRET